MRSQDAGKKDCAYLTALPDWGTVAQQSCGWCTGKSDLQQQLTVAWTVHLAAVTAPLCMAVLDAPGQIRQQCVFCAGQHAYEP
jgi:hypothetical protein